MPHLVEAWQFQRKYGSLSRLAAVPDGLERPPPFQSFIPGRCVTLGLSHVWSVLSGRYVLPAPCEPYALLKAGICRAALRQVEPAVTEVLQEVGRHSMTTTLTGTCMPRVRMAEAPACCNG